MEEIKSDPQIRLGTAYYPEHWPEERWPEDIRLMQAANLTVVRMAEFAWSTMEPSAGEFNFGWLDRAINQCATADIVTVLGTPTAAPPNWLVDQHPDLLAVGEDGRRAQVGNRCHYCVTSPDLHTAANRLVAAMAEHFGSHPSVIGWQFDNEYNRVCYCDRCRTQFQQFLAGKYGTLDTLNERWTTRYWGQTYSAWEQIPLPRGAHNPGLMLEFKHFITAAYRKFQRVQLDALRPHLRSGVWVTHNFMGWFGGFDHYTLAQDLDLAAWDWYIGFGHHDYLTSGAIHDLTRGFKRRNFWVIETQPGNVNWRETNTTLDRNEARAMVWHAVAHGADAILFWQWRSALGGQEQYHGTLVDQSGQPRPFYAEAKQIGEEIRKISGLVAGSTVRARVAMLNSYDSRWSIEFQRHHQDFDYVSHFNHYYRALAANNVNVDVLSADEDLTGYRLVIAPALIVLNDQRVENLTRFVEHGGHLVVTLRTGMKDEFNALLPARQPGPLARLTGAEVEEYYALAEPVPVKGKWLNGTARVWAERLKLLEPDKTIPISFYGKSNGWLDDQVALAVHPFGRGMVYAVGVYLDEAAQQAFVDHVLNIAGVRTTPSPLGVEVRARVRPDGTEVFFVINHTAAEQTLAWPWPARDHLTGEFLQGNIKLGGYAVKVLSKSAPA
jgi:beta-galactosidase